MPAIDAYGERKAMEVRDDTWGHLAPKPRRRYKGTILIAESEYAYVGRCVIRSDFADRDGESPESPWFYDAMMDFVGGLEGLKEGGIYLWTGYYQFFRGKADDYIDRASSSRFVGSVAAVPTP